MTLQQEALYTVQLLPEEKLPTLIAFVRFLTQSDSFPDTASSGMDALTRKRRSVAGVLRGQVRMSKDFNETPDVFKEYL